MIASTTTTSIAIAMTLAALMSGCTARPEPIALSDYLGARPIVDDDVVRITALGVRAPRPQDLVVDLALEGSKDDVGYAAHMLWFAYQRGEQDWISIADSSGRRLPLWTHREFRPPLEPNLPTVQWFPNLAGR